MWEWLQNDADKAFGWSFLGFWVGLAFGAVGVWATFFYQRRPRLSVDILSRTPVLSLKERIDNLQIIYDNADILECQKKLYVMTLRIANIGRVNIGKGDYDNHAPLSFQITDTDSATAAPEIEVIQAPEVLRASDDYLANHMVFQLLPQATIAVEPIILDAGAFFTIKLIALMPEAIQPTINVFGKVAGVKEFERGDEFSAHGESSFPLAVMISILLGSIVLAFIWSYFFPISTFVDACSSYKH